MKKETLKNLSTLIPNLLILSYTQDRPLSKTQMFSLEKRLKELNSKVKMIDRNYTALFSEIMTSELKQKYNSYMPMIHNGVDYQKVLFHTKQELSRVNQEILVIKKRLKSYYLRNSK